MKSSSFCAGNLRVRTGSTSLNAATTGHFERTLQVNERLNWK